MGVGSAHGSALPFLPTSCAPWPPSSSRTPRGGGTKLVAVGFRLPDAPLTPDTIPAVVEVAAEPTPIVLIVAWISTGGSRTADESHTRKLRGASKRDKDVWPGHNACRREHQARQHTRSGHCDSVLRAVAASQARWPSAMHSQLSHVDGSDRLTFQLHDEAAMQYAHQLAS